MKRILMSCVVFLGMAGCQYKQPADLVVQQKQEQIQAEAVREVGIPNVTRFTEMKRFRYLYPFFGGESPYIVDATPTSGTSGASDQSG